MGGCVGGLFAGGGAFGEPPEEPPPPQETAVAQTIVQTTVRNARPNAVVVTFAELGFVRLSFSRLWLQKKRGMSLLYKTPGVPDSSLRPLQI